MNQLRTFWDKSFTDWRYRIVLHVVFWVGLLFFGMQESSVVKINWQQHYSVTLMGIMLSLFLFYVLVYAIVPLIQKGRWFQALLLFIPYYAIAVILRSFHIALFINWYNLGEAWVTGNDFGEKLYANLIDPVGLSKVFFSSVVSLAGIIYLPLMMKFVRSAYNFNMRQVRLANENARLQLKTLKAQINPHFFFNTLNNLQSFIVQNEKEKSVQLLSQLSDFMRSSLYDCEQEQISMKQEMSLLSNYVAIERVRFDEKADISVTLQDSDPEYLIPPFIFLPFIENTFKHAASDFTENIFIEITLQNTIRSLRLETKNTYYPEPERGGIGLQNIGERLQHYFPHRHVLDIKRTDRFYSITLEITKS